jgi:Proprotein convertase P-domain
MTKPSLICLVAAAALTSCVASSDSLGTSTGAITEGTPDAYGIVKLLNDPSTTFSVLDDLVPLDKRAATNLIAHRDGADGVRGTTDDDRFDTVAEVDAVPYVGDSALDHLRAYAAAHGYTPSGGDLLGTYDNVAFTVDEANATLALVNDADAAELDDTVGLDARAVSSIVAARPIGSVLALSGLYYVGHAAMLKLRDYPGTAGAGSGAGSGSSTGTKPLGDDCQANTECTSGLCAGLVTTGSYGWCVQASMAGTFTNTTPLAIGDDGAPVLSTIPVAGLATVPLDVVVDLQIDHPRPQDLVVVLHQPGNAEAILWNHTANPPTHFVTPSGIEGDNMVNGDWQLEITDTVSGQSGTLVHWSMWISSNWD